MIELPRRLEIIPLRSFEQQIDQIPAGEIVTVTSSPKFGVERTLEFSELLAERGFEVVPHLAAKSIVDRAHLVDVVARARAIGVREVFVIGGDGDDVVGCYKTGLELLEALGELDPGFELMGVAAYPEGHPDIDDATLLDALRRKERLATYMATQMCFDAPLVVDWLARVRAESISLPVYVGVAGAIRPAKLASMSLKLGVGQSVRYLMKQHGLLGRLLRPSAYRPAAFIRALDRAASAHDDLGVAGFHLFTFNEIAGTVAGFKH